MMYPQLEDVTLLRDLYERQMLGTNRIAEILGVRSCNSVRQALIKHGIHVRSIREGLLCARKDQHFKPLKSVLDGCLLGDGSLRKWSNESSESCPYFVKKNKYTEHVRWVASFLYIDVPEDRLFEDHTKLRGRVFRHAVLRTLSEEQLRPYHERWYPASNGYVKRVPEDVVLDPVSLLHWFLDDGCAWRRRKESAKKQVIITFASESFTKEDQEHVVEKLKEIYGLPFRVKPYTQGTGWRIELSQGGVPEFYEIIGACPEPIKKVLGYKWK